MVDELMDLAEFEAYSRSALNLISHENIAGLLVAGPESWGTIH